MARRAGLPSVVVAPLVKLLLLATLAQDACALRKQNGRASATQSLSKTQLEGALHAGSNASAKEGTAALAAIGPPTVIPTWATWKSEVTDTASHIWAAMSVAVVVKIACMVGNVLVQVSPIPQVQDWEGKGSTGSADAAPFVSMALVGWQWCIYGCAAWLLSGNDGFLVLVYANCLGALLGCYYTFMFHRHCRDDGASNNLRQYLGALASLASAQTCMWLLLPHNQALAIHSYVAGGCSFVLSVSLLAGLPPVLRTGDTSGLCGPLIVANFFGAFLWTYWGWLMSDPVIISANMFAAFASSICLYVKLAYEAPVSSGDGAVAGLYDQQGGGKMGLLWGKPGLKPEALIAALNQEPYL